jgi:hypothetical protein
MESYWTDLHGVQWQVIPTFADLGDGRIECVGVVVRSFRERNVSREPGKPDIRPVGLPGGPAPVTRTLLKSLPLGALVDESRRHLAEFDAFVATARGARAFGVPPSGQRIAARLAAELKGELKKRPGRPLSFTHEDFDRLSRIYAEAHANNRKPTRAVAQAFNLSPSQAARRVHQARELGYLGPTSRGVAGGVVPKKRRKG